jgi:hypothetical protein
MCAHFLDNKRLNKQILECDTLIDLHEGRRDNNWKNHTAFKMWIGYVSALKSYRDYMLSEWLKRGKKNKRQFYGVNETDFIDIPGFVYDDRVILSHRSNLVRKLPEFYKKYGWKDYGIEGYYWPCEVKTKRSQQINEQWDNLLKGMLNEISEILD